MSVTSIPTAPPRLRVENVEFIMPEGAAHPAQLIYALAGVGAALDRIEPTNSSRADFELVGNLSVAAHILAKQLADRLA